MSQDEIPPSNEGTVAVEGISALTIQDPESSVANDRPELPHRSHDPENNMKRSDPFQFGSRYLSEKDNVFEFNAWDHVETDDTYKEYAELQYAKQREAPVSEFDKSTYFPLSLFPKHCAKSWYSATMTINHNSSEVTSL